MVTKLKDILIAVLVVVVLIVGYLIVKNSQLMPDENIESDTSETESEFFEISASTGVQTTSQGNEQTETVATSSAEEATTIITEADTEEASGSEENGGFVGATKETTVTTEPSDTEPNETLTLSETTVLSSQAYTGKTPQSKEVGSQITQSYVYKVLTEREQNLYTLIKTAAENLSETVDIETDGYTEDEWDKIFSIVYYQEPKLFWLEPYSEIGRLEYKVSDYAEIENMKEEINSTVSSMIENMSAMGNDLDRVKYIHDTIIFMNDFQKDGGESYSPTIYGALVTGKLQCEGYAKVFTYLCNQVGIESTIITGNVESGLSHAWNKVKIDGDWYNIDLTYDDPILTTPVEKYIKYNYFLVPDEWILNVTHFRQNLSQKFNSIEYYTAPAATAVDFNYFNYYDKVYNSIDEAKDALYDKLVEAINNKDAIVQVKVSDEDIYDELNSSLIEIKDKAKEETGVTFSRIAASKDDNMLIIGISFGI